MLMFANQIHFPGKVMLVFIVDGLQTDAINTAMENGATNFKFLHDNGIWVKEAYSVSPAPRLVLPDGSLPWAIFSTECCYAYRYTYF